jgi:hypothetical protein
VGQIRTSSACAKCAGRVLAAQSGAPGDVKSQKRLVRAKGPWQSGHRFFRCCSWKTFGSVGGPSLALAKLFPPLSASGNVKGIIGWRLVTWICLLAQMFQTAACNATHTIVQRTAKWLLAGMARTGSVEFEMTQDQLAEILGVARTFVTRIVSQLRHEGVLETRQGVIIFKDEPALRGRSCRCATAIEDHFDTVLHGIYPIA